MKNKFMVVSIFLLCCLCLLPLFSLFSHTNMNSSNNTQTNIVDFSSLNMACLGDSITQGIDGCSGNPYNMVKPYPTLLKETLGLNTCVNYGVSGSTIGKSTQGYSSISQRYTTMADDFDIVSVLCGVNDWNQSVPLGNITDDTNTTTYGGLNILFNGLKEKYPNSFIFVMTPFPCRNCNSKNSQGVILADISNAIKIVAKKYDIPILDLYKYGKYELELNQPYSDGVHPSQQFLEKYTAPQIAQFIKDNYKK